ncbi:RdgB/HAM1 family non-canonical purine NTP pyrophosphatase [bacterium]|nr:RdgB/HAM1 family non-canonical purine NTP pyrophosphatase [bacterium]MBQ9149554.1 RdgB/HAM1 family non-canonical purine NTP pyrophosphatase [bacterium]
MFQITLATGNKHKVEEINLIAKNYNIEFVLPNGDFNPIEDSDNFLGNAYCKAKCASKSQTTELYLADDSGLCVEALDGKPGIHSARYAPTAKERINKLLDTMQGIENRNAYFTCAMVIVNKKGEILFEVQENCYGSILKEERGAGGFGYDPIFFVKTKNKGMAELTPEEKAKVSHRACALNKVLEWIKNEYLQNKNK